MAPSSPAAQKLRAAVRCVQSAHRMQQMTISRLSLPLAEGTLGHDDLSDLHPTSLREPTVPTPQNLRYGLVRRASLVKVASDAADSKEDSQSIGALFWLSASVSVLCGLASSVPYNLLLSRDPGSPLFMSFIVHLFVVGSHLRQARALLQHRKLPLRYHGAIVVLGFMFNTLKCNAFARLPTPVCFLLLNLRMLVGVVVQRVGFSKRYSAAQLTGCALVTIGVTTAGWSMNSGSGEGVSASSGFLRGSIEMLLSLLSLQLMGIVIKKAFTEFGECVDEQLFFQHLLALPLFFQPGQWSQIQPRFNDWFVRKDLVMMLLLMASVMLTFGSRVATVQMAGRAPNQLMVQLVQTFEKFLTLFLSTVMHVPPWPPLAFWLGALILVLGSIQFLSASDVPSADVGNGEKANKQK